MESAGGVMHERQNFMEKYTELSDDELLLLIRENDDGDATETLVKRYGPMVTRQSRSLYIIGADEEDIIQEGMIGLLKAINNFSPDKGATFKTFAYMCIRRQIISAVNNSNNKKNVPLNYYISIYDGMGENSSVALFPYDAGANPEDIMLERLRESRLLENIDVRLSKLEKAVLEEYLTGESYEVIAQKLERPVKSVDNAVQRIRNKLRSIEET